MIDSAAATGVTDREVQPVDAGVEAAAAAETDASPPGGPGDLSPVEVGPQETLPPVEVDESAELAGGLAADVSLAQVTVQARRPGEIGGAAVEVTVTISNEGGASRDVSTAFLTVEDAEGTPLSPLYSDPYSPLGGEVEPGASTVGAYVFTLDESLTQPFTVYVMSAADEPVAAFVGGLE